jgi:hypothetical protein
MADNVSSELGQAVAPVALKPVNPSKPDGGSTGRFSRLISMRVGTDATRSVANAMFGALVLGLLSASFGARDHWLSALLWGGACSAVGWATGFLFGIPRTLAGDAGASATRPVGNATPQPGQAAQANGKSQRTGTNTNLEQISDWLTKIIVGATLVQIQPVLANLDAAAKLIAESLGGVQLKSFAFALMVYFAVTGFLGSYLLTRLFLQPALDSDNRDH